MTVKKTWIAAATAALVCWAGSAQAQSEDRTVTLKSFDGFTQLRGELVDFDGSSYRIATPVGMIEVDALLVDCEGPPCPEDLLFGAEFAISGSNTIGVELMPALIQGYADSLDARLVREISTQANESVLRLIHPNGRELAAVTVDSGGAGNSFPRLASRDAAIAMSSRRIRDQEVDGLLSAGFGDPRDSANEHVVALDGLIAIVHQANDMRSISVEELALIFAGEVTNWSELGGPNRPINVYARERQSGTFDSFDSLVLRPFGAQLTARAQQVASNSDLSDQVASDPDGIGFTGLAFARAAKVLAIRQECGITSRPTPFAMKTEEYPLARRLYLYDLAEGSPAHARQLVRYASSGAAQGIIEDAGFISDSIETQSLEEQGARLIYGLTGEDEFSLSLMREMLNELRDAERLSVTFRFTPGSSALETRSEREALALAEGLINGQFEGKEVLLVGFTDSIGEFTLNRGLARRRAQGVFDLMVGSVAPGALDDVPVRVLGYGELTPVGCNSSFQGRLANRRVEVWLRDIPVGG
ncbi:MAG: phosphate ABC transporter substrate-binding/OmpA family protein [Pseudomonadota bacterium]